ncbi:hypothetical protein D3C85_1549880 [compost metagenome]
MAIGIHGMVRGQHGHQRIAPHQLLAHPTGQGYRRVQHRQVDAAFAQRLHQIGIAHLRQHHLGSRELRLQQFERLR